MATLSNRQGSRFVQYTDANTGDRRTLTLGKMGEKQATVIQSHVEAILHAIKWQEQVPGATASWLKELPAKLLAKLVKLGLVAPREVVQAATLDKFIGEYIDRRTDLKPLSLNTLKQARKALVEHFGADRDLRTINRAEAGDYRRWLAAKYAGATVALHVKKAKQFFADAVERGLIESNPFLKLKGGSFVNEDRNQYVPAADVEKVIAACPDSEWRVAFALARYGGLRVPSEVRRLKWTDFDWSAGRFVVTSPKTEHHAGKDRRVVPIFPELLPHLREAFEAADEGAVHVLSKLRGDNLGTSGRKIIIRAGLAPWPRTWQNLRASRETDLADQFPIKVVCAWIGNSPSIAAKHYLLVTDEHFEKALRNPLRHTPERRGMDRKSKAEGSKNAGKVEVLESRREHLDPFISRQIAQESHEALLNALHSYQHTSVRRARNLLRASRRLKGGRR